MSLSKIRCSQCGFVTAVSRHSGQPPVCGHCRHPIDHYQLLPRPMPGGSPPAQGDDAGQQDEPTAFQAAFAESLPWAMSVAFHLAVLLLLTFVTLCIESPGRPATAAAIDELTPPGETSSPRGRLDLFDIPAGNLLREPDLRTGRTNWGSLMSAPVPPSGDGNSGGKGPNFDVGVRVPGPLDGNGGNGDGTGTGLLGPKGPYGVIGGPGFCGLPPVVPGPTRAAKSIVFVVDNSGSMTTTFDYVKNELTRCTSQLQPRQQFAVIMFSDGPPLDLKIAGQAGLHHASPNNRKAAAAWIAGQYASSYGGETLPGESLKRAFALKPALIYLLTDGLFPKDTIQLLAGLNRDKKVVINTIAYVRRDGEPMLRQIAKEHGGLYAFVPESELGKSVGAGDSK